MCLYHLDSREGTETREREKETKTRSVLSKQTAEKEGKERRGWNFLEIDFLSSLASLASCDSWIPGNEKKRRVVSGVAYYTCLWVQREKLKAE